MVALVLLGAGALTLLTLRLTGRTQQTDHGGTLLNNRSLVQGGASPSGQPVGRNKAEQARPGAGAKANGREGLPLPWQKDFTTGLPASVKLLRSVVTCAGAELPVGLVTDLASALDLDSPTAASSFTLKVNLGRDAGKLKCMIWSSRGRRALAIDDLNAVSGVLQPAQDWGGQTPDSIPLDRYTSVNVDIMEMQNGQTLLTFTGHDQYGRPVSLGQHDVGPFRGSTGYAVAEYRYGVLTKYKGSQYVGALVVDMKAYRPVVSVDLPRGLSGFQPRCVLGPKADAIAVVDGHLKWMHVVDLQPLFPETPK